MGDRELDRFIAEKVMGWEAMLVEDPHTNTPPFLNYVDSYGRGRIEVDRYIPTTDLNLAFEALQKYCKGSKVWTLEGSHEASTCYCYVGYRYPRLDSFNSWSASANTLAMAICLAIKKAKEESDGG